MKLSLLIAASFGALLCSGAQAQPRKCVAHDGKVTYSDVACPDSTASERAVETHGNTLDGSELREQAQKSRAAAAQNEAKEREQAAADTNKRQQAQTHASDAAKREAQKGEQDWAAYANCTGDVERQSVTEDVKAELFAACRTAGSSQRQSGMTEAGLRECVRSVERTGAYARDKARQIAICHGADVKPEPLVVVPAPRARSNPHRSPRITGCNGNQCLDDAGQRYFKQQGSGLVREDGKFCQLAADNRILCP